jgi:hypothetical protein
MKLSNYFKKKLYNGQLINMIYNDLCKKQKFKDILFIRTPTTGGWMDDMLLNNSEINITRILYQPNNIITDSSALEHSKLESYLTSLNKKFDLIFIDPFHCYYESNKDLLMLPSFMTDNGILICHDCFPSRIEYATPNFKKGIWSGVTYICFVELAYAYPDWWYAVFNNDTGVGILSKQKLDYLEQKFDRTKQKKLIEMNKNGDNNTYDYYCQNSKDLINLIDK